MRIFSSIRSSLFALVLLALSAAAYAQIGISVSLAPPELPTFEQPLCPGDGYLWTPGYWAYADTDTGYYWVPGAWVMAPEPNFLWTPGYWGWGGNGYAFNEGYWGLHVGFYGGVSYGYGYFGNGYEGGRWQEGHFFYNRSVNNVNITSIHNVYNTTVIHNNMETRVSYNGGSGGIDRRPTAEEESFAHERHVGPVAVQNEHAQAARANPEQRASAIHASPAGAVRPENGQPETARPETARPDTARAGDAHPETARPETDHPETAATRPVVHPNDMPARQPFAAPNSGNAARDQKIEQQHTQLIAKQDQERQQLQQKQDREHQQQASQKTNEAGKQRLEQQHQQQTQKLQQKHTQQEQKLQGKIPPANPKHAGV